MQHQEDLMHTPGKDSKLHTLIPYHKCQFFEVPSIQHPQWIPRAIIEVEKIMAGKLRFRSIVQRVSRKTSTTLTSGKCNLELCSEKNGGGRSENESLFLGFTGIGMGFPELT